MTWEVLPDGLRLRQATPADHEALLRFEHASQPTSSADAPSIPFTVPTRTRHSFANCPEEHLLIEERETGQIVSALCMSEQQWAFHNIDLSVNQIKLLGTHHRYRRHGLVPKLLEAAHRACACRGQQAQVIDGIFRNHREFGYECALQHGHGYSGTFATSAAYFGLVNSPYLIRPATTTDLPFMQELDAEAHRCVYRSDASVRKAPIFWRYEVNGNHLLIPWRARFFIIETTNHQLVGWFKQSAELSGRNLLISRFELQPDRDWHTVTAAIVQYMEANTTDRDSIDGICFALGGVHPVYQVLGGWLNQVNYGNPLYVRIPDLAAFLRHITPVFQMRLARSTLARYTGTLAITCGQEAIYFSFNTGTLINIESEEITKHKQGDAAFPHQSFLQLLFGMRSQAELERSYAGRRANIRGRTLLNALFPKQNTELWMVR